MDSSANIALNKIITAFGEVPKNLTRLQIFAKVARLANDIHDRRLYPDIPEAERQEVLENLKRYFLFYRAEDYLIHQPLFYPRAILYWASSKFIPVHKKYQVTTTNIDRFTKRASRVPGYTAIFNACLSELSQHPDEYPSMTAHELLVELGQASTIKVPILRSLFKAITGYTRHETISLLRGLSVFSHKHDSEQVSAAIEKTYKPSLGPDTAEELFFSLAILIDYARNPKIPKTFTYNAMMNSFLNLVHIARGLCRDIPEKNLSDQFESLPNPPVIKLARARLNYTQAETFALAMGRYYLERHKDKLTKTEEISMSEVLSDLYISSFVHSHATMNAMGIPSPSEEEMEILIQRMLHETWAEWDRPSVEELVEHFEKSLPPKNANKFRNLIQTTAPYFDLQVTYYAEQNEIIRRLRRNIFKQGSLGGEVESYRSSFLKSLAENHSDKLTEAGFDDQQIRFMHRTGKLPDTPSEPSWNVDHIVDIHAGGTNNLENLCLMPTALNEAKNTFLLLQTNSREAIKSGYWVLTLKPKLEKDGNPIPILLPKKQENPIPNEAPHISPPS